MVLDVPPLCFAPLKTVRLRDLHNGSPEEKAMLLAAAKEDGIFYLDFSEDLGEHKLGDLIQDIYHLSQSLFDLELEEKMQYDVDKIGDLKLNGYVSTFFSLLGRILILS